MMNQGESSASTVTRPRPNRHALTLGLALLCVFSAAGRSFAECSCDTLNPDKMSWRVDVKETSTQIQVIGQLVATLDITCTEGGDRKESCGGIALLAPTGAAYRAEGPGFPGTIHDPNILIAHGISFGSGNTGNIAGSCVRGRTQRHVFWYNAFLEKSGGLDEVKGSTQFALSVGCQQNYLVATPDLIIDTTRFSKNIDLDESDLDGDGTIGSVEEAVGRSDQDFDSDGDGVPDNADPEPTNPKVP